MNVVQPSPSPLSGSSVTPPQAEPSASPLPVIVTDVVRDTFDKWSFGITVGSAVAGLLLSSIAVFLALQAKRDTADAEVRAIGRATRERRILFELEILRDLVEGLAVDALKHRIVNPHHFRQVYGGSIRFFPSELPAWHAIAAMNSPRMLYDMFPAPQKFIDEFDRYAKGGGAITGIGMPPGITLEQVKERLLSEVKSAIDPRMNPLD